MTTAFTLEAVGAKKRVRTPRYAAFGNELVKWRGEMDIETAVRRVRALGIPFKGATLRGWEYGWTGRPDPLRLLALAHVYQKTPMEALRCLALARDVKLPELTELHISERRRTSADKLERYIPDTVPLADEPRGRGGLFESLSEAERETVSSALLDLWMAAAGLPTPSEAGAVDRALREALTRDAVRRRRRAPNR